MRTHLFAAALASSVLGVVAAPAPADSPALVIEQRNGARYVSGGIGVCEREALERLAGDFNLRLTFVTTNGHYLSDVGVRLEDARGERVLETVSEGPLLYAQVRPGTYRLEVDGPGKRYSQVASVGDRSPARITFRWPSEEPTTLEPEPGERQAESCA